MHTHIESDLVPVSAAGPRASIIMAKQLTLAAAFCRNRQDSEPQTESEPKTKRARVVSTSK